MLHVLGLLRDVAAGHDEFAVVPAAVRARAAGSYQRGLDCLLATQIRANGRRTVWCQQHDALTLQPSAARNYEMPAQASSESGEIILFLMLLPQPDSNIVAAVEASAVWFEKTRIADKAFKSTGGNGRQLLATPDAGSIWARFYEIGTDKPIFGDRDRSIHDTVAEISKERRNGYAWFKDTPKRVLDHYPRWHQTHAP
jgi:PelA/Pel-15E family pectate lyase